MLNWIENWFNSQCNGDWEHNYGMKIETIDNPGWNVEIDFNNTGLKYGDVPWKLYEKSENNWIGIKVENNKFYSSGDPKKLHKILEIFKFLIESKSIEESFINSLLND